MTDEQKLQKWAEGQGINWRLARTQMIPGDVEAIVAQLAHAREHKSEADKACVIWTLRQWQARAAAVVAQA